MSTNNIYENLEDDEERSVDSQSGDISGLFAPDKEVEEEEERQEAVLGGVNSAGFLDHASGQDVPHHIYDILCIYKLTHGQNNI